MLMICFANEKIMQLIVCIYIDPRLLYLPTSIITSLRRRNGKVHGGL